METIILHPLKDGATSIDVKVGPEVLNITYDKAGNMYVYGVLVSTWDQRVSRYQDASARIIPV